MLRPFDGRKSVQPKGTKRAIVSARETNWTERSRNSRAFGRKVRIPTNIRHFVVQQRVCKQPHDRCERDNGNGEQDADGVVA
jgi:hypothetical protein